jgi:adenylosuccinate lyase
LLGSAQRLVRGLQVNERAVAVNLVRYGVFAATERLLMELSKAGADRQVMHERIRRHSMAAWEQVQAGRPNPLEDLLSGDPEVLHYLRATRVRALLDASGYVGDAPERARSLAAQIRERLAGF